MYYLIAFALGIGMAIQAPINASLGNQIHSLPMASLVNFLVGSVALALLCLCSGVFGGLEARLFAEVPLWKYVGGILGACFVFFAVLLMPKIGASAFVMLVIVGQLIASLMVDKFGLFNMTVRQVGLPKLAGLGIMLLGLLIYFGKEIADLLKR